MSSVAVPSAALAISAFSAISATGLERSSQAIQEYIPTAMGPGRRLPARLGSFRGFGGPMPNPGRIVVGGFRTFRYPARAGNGVEGASSVSASEGVCALSATPTDPSASLREGRHQTSEGLVMGVSAISAADTPIANSSVAAARSRRLRILSHRYRSPKMSSPPVSAGFRRCATSSAGPVFPKDSRFPPFAPFPPLIWRPWTSRRQSVRVVPAAAADRAAPVEASILMNIMPILCRRSAGISHNIAQERQARVGHIPCNGAIPVGRGPLKAETRVRIP